jgi:hypothetical protein
MKLGTPSFILVMALWIWKQQGMVVFDNKLPNFASLLDTIKSDARIVGEGRGGWSGALLPAMLNT